MSKRALLAAIPALAALVAVTGCGPSGSLTAASAYELIKWGSPKPISERVTAAQYSLPDGWKSAVAGVTRLRVSSFGALRNDPATAANARRFQELTGIAIEILPWAEQLLGAKTVAVLSAHSDTVDVLCYDHAASYMRLVGAGWVQPLDALWNDPNLWKHYPNTLQKGLTASDGRIYGAIGRAGTQILCYRPSVVGGAPGTWQEVRQAAKTAARAGIWGYVFSAGGGGDVVYPFSAMVYSQGGRLVDAARQRLIVNSPEGRNAWRMLADMVLFDRSAPASAALYSWMEAADAFALGKAAMVLARPIDTDRFRDPQTAPGLGRDWAAGPAPRWDAEQPDTSMASRMDLEGYAINRFIEDRQKAAAMLFLDFMRSSEAASRELIDEGNEAAVLAVHDLPAAKRVPLLDARRVAMTNAVLEPLPPAARELTGLMSEFFLRAAGGVLDAGRALEELQLRLDDYAVPEK